MRFASLFITLLTSFGCSSIARTALPFNDLPQPNGPFAVGTNTETWVDSSREEAFTGNAGDPRRIVVQYWYPAEYETDSDVLPYIDSPDVRLNAFAKNMGLPKFLVDHIREVKTHSVLGAAVQSTPKAMPLIVFSHGLGGMKSQNTINAEELASHGYIVIGVDHAFDSYLTVFDNGDTADYRSSSEGLETEEDFWAARGPQLATRTADIRFMLDVIESRKANDADNLWQHVDMDRVGIFGHSFGGATSIMALRDDPRIRAAIALDGWMVPIAKEVIKAGSQKPVLYIGQERWDDPFNYRKLDKFIASSDATVTRKLIPGTKHMDFADAPHLSNFAKRFGFAGSVPSAELREMLNTDILNFFAKHLDFDQGRQGQLQ